MARISSHTDRHRWRLAVVLLLPLLSTSAQLQRASPNERLLEAAGKGDVAAAKAALDDGADVNADNGRGGTPLYHAAEQGRAGVARLLIERGADVNVKDLEWGRTPLRHASLPDSTARGKKERAEIIQMLIDKGAGSDGDALSDLISGGHIDAAKTILGRGNVDPSYLNTALRAANRVKATELIDILTKAGAKEPGPMDAARSPERLQLVNGLYRSTSGQEVTLGQSAQGDTLLIGRRGQDRLALLPLDFRMFRSFDMKLVMTLSSSALPPSELTLKEGGRSEVYTRVGAAPVETTAAGGAAKPEAGSAPAAVIPSVVVPTAKDGNWPGFRGVGSTGIAADARPPVQWDLAKGTNIAWKTPIPGLAHSSPVIWGNRVFVTTAIPATEDSVTFRHGSAAGSNVDAINRSTRDDVMYAWRVFALDRDTGKIVWNKTAHEGMPRSQRHVSQTQANSTPATDGTHLVVWFGSEGLYCYDFNGTLLWKKDLGPLISGYVVDPSYEWNTASSPVIYKGRIILQVDLIKESFIAAFDVNTGKEIWRTPRTDEAPSWATPLVYEGPARTEIVTLAPNYARGYDPQTGKELWRLGKHSIYASPSPIPGPNLFVITSGSGNSVQPIYAIRPGANGDITLKDDEDKNGAVQWSKLRGGAYIPTPLLYDGLLYVTSEGGILAAYKIDTGERVYQQRMTRGGSYSSSAVAADGRIYFASEDGDVIVAKAGPTFEKLAQNPMDEMIMASPAVSRNMIVYRTQHNVIAVEERSRP
jgi:outer membrane protein assembly factor BamB